jgi:DMSO/TMAO reductase YedYZ molybdopterin-dependent catalytic subunit
MTKNRIKRLIPFFIVIIVIFSAAVFISFNLLTSKTGTLSSVEVTEYQGQKLSSISDEPEVSIDGPQYINQTTYRLVVTGLVNRNLNLTYDQIMQKYKSYQKVVTLNCVEGWSVTILWQGFLVKDLLNDAGIKPNATTIILYAADNYSTSFPISYLLDNNIMMAYKMNNVTLSPRNGFPFQLVAESKWGYKWIKWITKIEVSDNSTYQGYWEQRGYSNSGNLNSSFISSSP